MKKSNNTITLLSPTIGEIEDLKKFLSKERFDVATKLAQHLTEKYPKYAQGWAILSEALNGLNKIEDCIHALKKATELNTDNADYFAVLGLAQTNLGNLEEAKQSFFHAIDLNPQIIYPYFALSNFSENVLDANHLKFLEQWYLNNELNEKDRVKLAFTLANIYKKNRNYQAAFAMYKKANALNRTIYLYDIKKEKKIFESIKTIETNTKSFFLMKPQSTFTPIFIVGMNRSGSTLVEQIIGGATDVYNAGEIKLIPELIKKNSKRFKTMTENDVTRIRGQYISQISKIKDDSCFVTDKFLQNFKNIGLIARAFPEAKIIHMQRSPQAVCWSNYTCLYVNDSHNQSYDLNDMATYHNLYTDLMRFWKGKYSDLIYTVKYEKLAENPLEEGKSLFDFLGIQWEDRFCTSFLDSKKLIRTYSLHQVRKPIYQGSSEEWKNYESDIYPSFNNLILD
jgi:tetratricopeptide (TPR) repeat protein